MSYNLKPFWVVNLVREKYRREAKGVRSDDLDSFVGEMRVALTKPISEEDEDAMCGHEIGRNIVDVDEKEFANIGTIPDTFAIKTQKTSTAETKKAYQITKAKATTFGGEGGLSISTNFFNINGPGASIGGKASREKTKEKSLRGEDVRGLSQEYGILAKITVPPKKSIEVQITTYAVSYGVEVDLTASMPTNARLTVLAPRGFFGCCNRFIRITAADFLRMYTGEANNAIYHPKNNHSIICLDYKGRLQYIGEEVKIRKLSEKDFPPVAPPLGTSQIEVTVEPPTVI